MQQHSQNLEEYAPPSFFVLLIVLYCIITATVSHWICPVTGTASHTTHHTAWPSSQAACLYSSLISYNTSLLMSTHFYLQMTTSCSDKPINSVQAKATLFFAFLMFLMDVDSSPCTAPTQSLPQPMQASTTVC